MENVNENRGEHEGREESKSWSVASFVFISKNEKGLRRCEGRKSVCRSSSYFFFAAFFFEAFFFIGIVNVPPVERCSLEFWSAVVATPLIALAQQLPQDIVLTSDGCQEIFTIKSASIIAVRHV
jgi:hypothetical protein